MGKKSQERMTELTKEERIIRGKISEEISKKIERDELLGHPATKEDIERFTREAEEKVRI